jgi:hypothetical protein
VAGGIGGEGEVIFFGGVAECIEDNAGLHAGDAAGGINLEDSRHVSRKIQHDGDVAALAGERGAAAAAEDGGSEFPAGGDCGEDVIGIAGENDADGNLTVVGGVGRVEGAAAGVEADVASNSISSSPISLRYAAKLRAQSFGEPRSICQ